MPVEVNTAELAALLDCTPEDLILQARSQLTEYPQLRGVWAYSTTRGRQLHDGRTIKWQVWRTDDTEFEALQSAIEDPRVQVYALSLFHACIVRKGKGDSVAERRDQLAHVHRSFISERLGITPEQANLYALIVSSTLLRLGL